MTKQNVIIRDLPGIADLEVAMMMSSKTYDGYEEDRCKPVAQRLFGIWIPDDHDILAEHQELHTSWEVADDEAMLLLMTLGIDFSDERGNPLRCTRWLAASAEVAVRGIAGHLPDQGQAIIDQMASKLERDREAFLREKRRGKR